MLMQLPLCMLILLTIVESTEAGALVRPLAKTVENLRAVNHPQFKILQMKMKGYLESLQKLEDDKKNEPSDEYRVSMKQNQEALKQAYSADVKDKEKIEVCGAIAQDLAVKNKFAQKNPRAAFKNVEVVAHTRDDGNNEKPGFEVWYVPRAWEKDKARHKRFDSNSSPTVRPMPPGAYIMWTKVPNQDRLGKKQPIDIGDHGQTNQNVDLPIP